MSASDWTDVDTYIDERLLPPDPDLEAILAANAAGGLPAIDVSPAQGRFLNLMVKVTGARRILEIGTLGGYSTVCMASALPADGEIVTLEYSPKHAAVAQQNFDRAGVSSTVKLHIGAALETLPKLAGPFDLFFIDADKSNSANYLEWALKLSRVGSVIILDNVVRGGGVINSGSTDPNIRGTRAAFDILHNHPRVDSTALQTVGSKGWDGFILGVVKAP